MWAAKQGHLEIVEALLRSNPTYASDDRDHYGMTALMLAVQNDHKTIVEALLRSNLTLASDKDDASGKTALMLAAQKGESGVIDVLLDSNSSLAGQKNNAGATAFVLAIESRSQSVREAGVSQSKKIEVAKHLFDFDKELSIQGGSACVFINRLKGMGDEVLNAQDRTKKAILLEATQMLLATGSEATVTMLGGSSNCHGWSTVKVNKSACYNADEILENHKQYPHELPIMVGYELVVDALFRQHTTCGYTWTGEEDREKDHGESFYSVLRREYSSAEMMGKFLTKFGVAVMKHKVDGKTLLMKAAENGTQPVAEGFFFNWWARASVFDCENSTVFKMIRELTFKYSASPDKATEDGYSASMLAAIAGNEPAAKELLEDTFQSDASRHSPIYKMSKHPIRFGLIMGLSLVALAAVAVVLDIETYLKAVNFVLRANALFISNYVIVYGKDLALTLWEHVVKDPMPAQESLQNGFFIGSVPWNFTLGCWFVPVAVLACLSLSFTMYDLFQASKASKNDSEEKADEGSLFPSDPLVPLVPSDVYQDTECPIVNCLHRFFLASVFLGVYITKVMSPLPSTLQSRTFWGLSLFVQMHIHWPEPGCEPKDLVSALRWLCCADIPMQPRLWQTHTPFST
ncbi:unnamed protein product [Polarella glacialis]|uniref:Uncharacterized protein n=1 Tax=Polarella glacialis TaxID=89957 RepID=A0A813HG98_POLGL|nr:unnamed protein product [Polarella glacialis]